MNVVPDGWWKSACEKVNVPLACVCKENRFVWINDEWCKLLGYAPNELLDKTWMEITRNEDVGGDLDAVNEVIEGKREEY